MHDITVLGIVAVLVWLSFRYRGKAIKDAEKLFAPTSSPGKRGWADAKRFLKLQQFATGEQIATYQANHARQWFFIGALFAFVAVGLSQRW